MGENLTKKETFTEDDLDQLVNEMRSFATQDRTQTLRGLTPEEHEGVVALVDQVLELVLKLKEAMKRIKERNDLINDTAAAMLYNNYSAHFRGFREQIDSIVKRSQSKRDSA